MFSRINDIALRFATVLVGVLVAWTAYAGYVSVRKTTAATVLTSKAINAASYTGWVSVPESRCVAFEIAYVYSAATAVTMSCETSDSAATADGSGFDVVAVYDSGTLGTSTSVVHTWSNAVSADESWTWSVCSLPHDYVNCVFDGTSADGDDKVTVKHRRSTP